MTSGTPVARFEPILRRAEERKGGPRALRALLPPVPSHASLAKRGDDRFLAMMCKVVNQAGFAWRVIERKWPQFEAAFLQFDPQRLARLPPEDWEAYLRDPRVVRHWQRIKALRDNVDFVCAEADRHGSFGRFLASWPADDQVGLAAYLARHGARLGGYSAHRFLRYAGWDAFILTGDVVNVLRNAGVEINEQPGGKRELRRAQEAFNAWHIETGLPYCHLSRIAAFSTGDNVPYARLKAERDQMTRSS
ncbi:MAG: DNA-3-methyladenine glycosylase I [Gammaproteobacteria bacterium]